MLVTMENGDAKELAELMKQDPGFNVNSMPALETIDPL